MIFIYLRINDRRTRRRLILLSTKNTSYIHSTGKCEKNAKNYIRIKTIQSKYSPIQQYNQTKNTKIKWTTMLFKTETKIELKVKLTLKNLKTKKAVHQRNVGD